MKKLKLTAFLLLFIFAASSCSKESKKEQSKDELSGSGKDMIVVLDTSMSMIGQGGQNILSQVKDSLVFQVDKLQTGDSFTFVTFDEATKIYPTVVIDDVSKIDVIKKYVSMVEAKGLWTYTMDMLGEVVKRADEIDASNGERPVLLVFLTDAMDDPPPALKGRKKSIKDIADKDPKDWFVYFVNFGDAKKDSKLTGLSKDVADNISSKTKLIEGKDDPDKAMKVDLQTDIDKVDSDAASERLKKILFIAIPLILLIILVYVIIMLAKRAVKVRGFVQFKQIGTFRAEIKEVDLGSFKESKVTFGRNALDSYRIMDFSDRKPLIFLARKFSGAVKVVIDEDNSTQIEYSGDKKEIFLKEGDSFAAGGYLFTYSEYVKNDEKK